MDDGFDVAFYASMGIGIGAGTLAVGLMVGAAYGVCTIGSMTIQQATFSTMVIANNPVYGVSATGVGYVVAEGLTGYPGSLSPDDVIRGISSSGVAGSQIWT